MHVDNLVPLGISEALAGLERSVHGHGNVEGLVTLYHTLGSNSLHERGSKHGREGLAYSGGSLLGAYVLLVQQLVVGNLCKCGMLKFGILLSRNHLEGEDRTAVAVPVTNHIATPVVPPCALITSAGVKTDIEAVL